MKVKTRKIKPAFWIDGDVARLRRDARLVFIGLWCVADDHGYVEDDLTALRLVLFPADWDLEDADLDAYVDELVTEGMVERTTAEDGQRLLRVVNLRRHQGISKPTRSRFAVREAFADPEPSPLPRTARGAARAAESRVPDDMPDDLRPYVEPVQAILAEIAAANPGATPPSAGGVARAIMDYANRDFLPVARGYRAWQLDSAKKKHRQIVSGYRNQLDMSDPVGRREPAAGRRRREDDGGTSKLERLGLL